MPVTSWNVPSAVTGTGWSAVPSGTLVDAVALSDDVRAEHATAADYLICSDFGFSLGGSDVVEGIEVEIESSTGAPIAQPGGLPYVGARLSKDATSPVGNEREVESDYPSDLTEIAGSSTDLWAATFSPAEINASGFAVLLKRGSSSAEVPTRGRTIDRVRVRIFYSSTGGAGAGMASKTRRIPDIGAIRNRTVSKRNN